MNCLLSLPALLIRLLGPSLMPGPGPPDPPAPPATPSAHTTAAEPHSVKTHTAAAAAKHLLRRTLNSLRRDGHCVCVCVQYAAVAGEELARDAPSGSGLVALTTHTDDEERRGRRRRALCACVCECVSGGLSAKLPWHKHFQ